MLRLRALPSVLRLATRTSEGALSRAYSTEVPQLRLGDTVPDFEADSTYGKLSLYSYLGDSWGVLYSHPKDYTPVCTTELGRTAKLKSEFERRNVKVLALSVDDRKSHDGWIKDINDTQGTKVNFPIIADSDKKVSTLYGMIHPKASDTFTVRSVFVIDPKKKLRLSLTYPASTGRNFDEILRVIDSLQLTENHKVATPVDWKHGEDCVIVPSIKDDEAKKLFPKGFKTIRPYLRMTPMPGK